MPVDEELVTDVTELVDLAADTYEDEYQRKFCTFPILCKLLGVDMTEYVGTNQGSRRGAESDALITCNLSDSQYKAITAHFEFKVELGMGGEGAIEGALKVRKRISADRVGTAVLLSVCVSVLTHPLV